MLYWWTWSEEKDSLDIEIRIETFSGNSVHKQLDTTLFEPDTIIKQTIPLTEMGHDLIESEFQLLASGGKMEGSKCINPLIVDGSTLSLSVDK